MSLESMRTCGALTRPWRDRHRPDWRWLTPDTSVQAGDGASRRGPGSGSAAADARRGDHTSGLDVKASCRDLLQLVVRGLAGGGHAEVGEGAQHRQFSFKKGGRN